jgi:hypothetical protein
LQVAPLILAINCLKEYDDLLLNYTLSNIQIQNVVVEAFQVGAMVVQSTNHCSSYAT